MPIKIRTKKVKGLNGKLRRILDIKALDRDRLPTEYLASGTRCFYNSYFNGLEIVVHESDATTSENFILRSSYVYPEENFQGYIEAIAKAGDRLKEINDRIRKEQKNWDGEETFII